MMVYGAYVPKDVSLTRSAVIIATADTVIALLAGLMIFPLVFANGLDPAEGPGLIFKTLPTAFVGMPGGAVFGALFFLLLAFAAVTSIIAIIEPIVAYAEDRWHMSRKLGCVVFGLHRLGDRYRERVVVSMPGKMSRRSRCSTYSKARRPLT